MTLNCLNCQALQRTNSSDSERDYRKKDKAAAYRKLRYVTVNNVNVNNVNVNNIDRSWSGNLTPPPFEQIHHSSSSAAMFMPDKKKSKGPGHRRLMTTGGVAYEGSAEPRLLRSSGMRRDWSFENLSLLRNNTNARK